MGANRDFKQLRLPLANGDADYHAFNLPGQRGDAFQIVAGRAGLPAHLCRNGDHGAAVSAEKLHMIQRQPFQQHPAFGFCIKHDPVDGAEINLHRHQLCSDPMGFGRGVGKFETAGIGGNAGIQRCGDLPVDRQV